MFQKQGQKLLTETEAKAPAKLRDLRTFPENPFLDGVGYNTRKRTEILFDGKQAVISTETGEVMEESLAVARVKHVDSDQFVKLYTQHLWVFFDLGKAAQRVAEFVLHQVGHRAIGRGEVLLTFGEYEAYYAKRTGGTRPTFMRGLQELASKNVIAKSPVAHVWWINPALCFNGDRARFITEIRRKKTSSQEALEAKGQQRLELKQPPE